MSLADVFLVREARFPDGRFRYDPHAQANPRALRSRDTAPGMDVRYAPEEPAGKRMLDRAQMGAQHPDALEGWETVNYGQKRDPGLGFRAEFWAADGRVFARNAADGEDDDLLPDDASLSYYWPARSVNPEWVWSPPRKKSRGSWGPVY